jgi:uncharacterized protein YjbI with pentapeptide repeats
MAFKDHCDILMHGVKIWNQWRKDNPEIIPQLSGVDLSEMEGFPTGLSNINLSNAYLEATNLYGLTMEDSNFEGAILYNSNCNGTLFKNTNFRSADLEYVNFCTGSLEHADFSDARLGTTIFGDCNLTSAKNLDKCIHVYPSIIDLSTLVKSTNLPLSFLRGCGLPDFIIDNVSTLKGDALIFYSCFISYSTQDYEFVTRLYADLQNKGIRCWFAPENMKGGKKLYDQINEAIRVHDKLLLVLSESSMNSDWVATEIKRARKREKLEKKQMLFPISVVPYEKIKCWELFDPDTGIDLASEIRSYYILDFSNWKNHSDYTLSLNKLIFSLK